MTLRGAMVAALVCFGGGCHGGDDGVSRDECARLREHIAELTVAVGAATLSDAECRGAGYLTKHGAAKLARLGAAKESPLGAAKLTM
jgi:hypothetical protein